MSEKLWKRVSDYPPPDGPPILVRHRITGTLDRYSNAYITLPSTSHNPATEWCELDLPTEVAPPPVDEQLDAEAQALRAGFLSEGDPTRWDRVNKTTQEAWRKVARRARELHPTNPWRPMSELEDRHTRQVLIKRQLGTVVILRGTARSSDAAYSREFWKEID